MNKMTPQLLICFPLLALYLQIAQVVAPVPVNSPMDLVQVAEHLTLTGALIVAVVILWRALSVKDTLIIKSTEEMTKALSSTAASNSELRKIIEDSIATEESLGDAITKLSENVSKIHDKLGSNPSMKAIPRQTG
jgi:hypothetical protein